MDSESPTMILVEILTKIFCFTILLRPSRDQLCFVLCCCNGIDFISTFSATLFTFVSLNCHQNDLHDCWDASQSLFGGFSTRKCHKFNFSTFPSNFFFIFLWIFSWRFLDFGTTFTAFIVQMFVFYCWVDRNKLFWTLFNHAFDKEQKSEIYEIYLSWLWFPEALSSRFVI